jgi:hypothetical protein
MKNFRQHISILLLAAVSLFVSPHDFLHELLEHHETSDELCVEGCGPHIGKEHHHCDCPQLSAPPFYHAPEKFTFSSSEKEETLTVHATSVYHFTFSRCIFLRGPPAIS